MAASSVKTVTMLTLSTRNSFPASLAQASRPDDQQRLTSPSTGERERTNPPHDRFWPEGDIAKGGFRLKTCPMVSVATVKLIVALGASLALVAACWWAWKLRRWLGIGLMAPVVILTLTVNFAPYPINAGAGVFVVFLLMLFMVAVLGGKQ